MVARCNYYVYPVASLRQAAGTAWRQSIAGGRFLEVRSGIDGGFAAPVAATGRDTLD